MWVRNGVVNLSWGLVGGVRGREKGDAQRCFSGDTSIVIIIIVAYVVSL